MEYLEGRSLKQIVRSEGALEPGRAIDIVIQILKAARFAHKRGIVHRDIKPHNVIVDDEDRAKVTDFGIARAGASDMTETGSIMGDGAIPLARSRLRAPRSTPVGPLLDRHRALRVLTGRGPFERRAAVTIALKQVSRSPRLPRELEPAIRRSRVTS